MGMPGKVASRLAAGLKKFKPILEAAQKKDVNESDTVIIVQDILHEVFGFDKYSDITSEHAIRGTYCDLAIRISGKIDVLVEVKPIGVELKDPHLKQAVDYAANQGCDWVILTTGVRWRVYKVEFAKPISQELVLELNLLDLNPRVARDLDSLGVLAKEGWPKGRLDEYAAARQARSRYSIAGVLMTPPVLDVIRRELRRITPGVRIEADEVKKVLEEEVLKREVLDGDKAKAAHKLIARASGRVLRATRTDDEELQPCADTTKRDSFMPQLVAQLFESDLDRRHVSSEELVEELGATQTGDFRGLALRHHLLRVPMDRGREPHLRRELGRGPSQGREDGRRKVEGDLGHTRSCSRLGR